MYFPHYKVRKQNKNDSALYNPEPHINGLVLVGFTDEIQDTLSKCQFVFFTSSKQVRAFL